MATRSELRDLWSAPAPPAPPIDRGDQLLAATALLVATLEVLLRKDLSCGPTTLLCIGSMGLLLLRRRHPLATTLLGFGFSVSLDLGRRFGWHLPEVHAMAFILLLAHALVRWGSGRHIVLGVAWVFGVATLGLLLTPRPTTDVVGGYTVVIATLAIGAAGRYRAAAQAQEIAQVVLRERELLARELHDTVAHHVSAIALQAQAALAVSATRPKAAEEALRVIASEASRSLDEMRSIVRVLRDDGAPERRPGPTVADLRELEDLHEQPPVRLAVTGDLERLPAPTLATLYRLTQESITNARRHAREPTRIDVSIEVGRDAVRLRVLDDGAEARASDQGGYGLRGMRERVGLLGGELHAGPSEDRGWLVSARLPMGGS